MSNTNDQGGVAITGGTLVWAIAAMFLGTVAGSVAMAALLEDPVVPITALLGAFAALVAVLGPMFAVKSVQRHVSRIEDKVDAVGVTTDAVQRQTNGGLQSEIRTTAYNSMQRALRDHLEATEKVDQAPTDP